MTRSARRRDDPGRAVLDEQRWELLARIHGALEPAFVALSAAWIALVVADLAGGGLPRSLDLLVWVIWGLFVVEFLVGLAIAPSRSAYLRSRWLTALSLLLPAFRILRVATAFRVLRAGRIVRSVSLLRVATSVNRGLAALGQTARRRGLGYVLAATGLVIVVGAAGMAAFETPGAAGSSGPAARAEPGAIDDFGDALWWTAYAMTTGAPSEPQTAEGRLLGWLLSLYGLGIFGYLTAILASHFVGRDREADAGPAASGASGVLTGT